VELIYVYGIIQFTTILRINIEGLVSYLPLEVLGLFRIIFKSANKHFEEIEKTVGISGAQLWALSEVANEPEITVSSLAKVMSLHMSTVSNLVDKLVEKSLVERLRTDDDRRVVKLRLTRNGQAILNSAPGPFRGILPEALMRMEDAELVNLRVHLIALVSLLERKSEHAANEPLGTPVNLKS
jgi:DNA-binding MarR family transcriptional regulator